MKTRLPRHEFQEALTAVATLTGGRTTKPILGCVKLAIDGDRLDLSATDGEAGLRLGVPTLSVDEPGQTVVQADRLLNIIREMADVEIALEANDSHCIIRGEGSEFKIYVQRPEDFPPVPGFEGEPDLVVDGDQIRRMIAWTIYAAARETSRFAINGVLWEKHGEQLFLIATDGRRLARAGGRVRGGGTSDFQAILPGKALNVFEKVFNPPRDADGWQVDVKLMPNQALLRSGDRVLSTVLVEGHFPKYDDVIPKDNDKCARVDRLEFNSAIRRAALLTTEESRAVKLSFSRDQLVITSQSPEQGEATIQVPIAYDGEPMAIGFNPAFVNDALRAISFEEIHIELKEPTRPGIICGEDKGEFLYVVMPVSLSS